MKAKVKMEMDPGGEVGRGGRDMVGVGGCLGAGWEGVEVGRGGRVAVVGITMGSAPSEKCPQTVIYHLWLYRLRLRRPMSQK